MRFSSICCDWMAGRHDYSEPVNPRFSGKVVKIDMDGVIDYESQLWEQIRCPSSDTSIRVKCDGRSLKFSGNIGRFQHADNERGISVMDCVDRWAEILKTLDFNLTGFGARFHHGQPNEWGTFLTRLDLAGNFDVSDYAALAASMMVRRIGQKQPQAGKYGPIWGYDSKRSNWIKAKLYDKTAELQGRRRSEGGATRARFEVQLGSEWLKRERLDVVMAWKEPEMAQIIYGRFADQVFRDTVSVTDWSGIPTRLRAYAVLWRDGVDIRTVTSKPTYYRLRAALLEYGIDIGTACNVIALTRNCRIVEVAPVSALREAA